MRRETRSGLIFITAMSYNWLEPVFLVERLNDVEQSQVELWVTVTGLSVAVLIVVLLLFTVSLKVIAVKTTRPCRWCMEFIPKAAEQCPRCGKHLPPDNAPENFKAS